MLHRSTMTRLDHLFCPLALAAVAIAVFFATVAQATDTSSAWPQWGNGILNQRWAVNETVIGPGNVGGLAQKWNATFSSYTSATPTVSGEAARPWGQTDGWAGGQAGGQTDRQTLHLQYLLGGSRSSALVLPGLHEGMGKCTRILLFDNDRLALRGESHMGPQAVDRAPYNRDMWFYWPTPPRTPSKCLSYQTSFLRCGGGFCVIFWANLALNLFCMPNRNKCIQLVSVLCNVPTSCSSWPRA
jgi:hypothetical protein